MDCIVLFPRASILVIFFAHKKIVKQSFIGIRVCAPLKSANTSADNSLLVRHKPVCCCFRGRLQALCFDSSLSEYIKTGMTEAQAVSASSVTEQQ